ncbi:hypothetical protein [Erysipelothrix anatis]|uniref:hypothetical protein n=1 Tax=Erysipelothrix anatis TaxID=2683713 RepID=UPI0013584463|nr:hypothetical protein [Erysipelothrix anatis]
MKSPKPNGTPITEYTFTDYDPNSDLYDANFAKEIVKSLTKITDSITKGSGVTDLVRNKVSRIGNIVFVEIAGTFTTGTGNKVVGTIPDDTVPERALRVIGVALTSSSGYGAQQFIINQGTREIVAENIPTSAQGGAFQLNISYTI